MKGYVIFELFKLKGDIRYDKIVLKVFKGCYFYDVFVKMKLYLIKRDENMLNYLDDIYKGF